VVTEKLLAVYISSASAAGVILSHRHSQIMNQNQRKSCSPREVSSRPKPWGQADLALVLPSCVGAAKLAVSLLGDL
jgi:hypothetical protein